MPRQCAHWLRNDRFLHGVRYKAGGRTEASAPTDGYKECNGRATARVAPTEALQGARWGGRLRGSPLRKRNMECVEAGRCGERTERCQWQEKRGERVAAVKISSVRRKAA